MATTITRATLTDSTSSTTGDILNAAWVGTTVYDKVDSLVSSAITFGSTIAERNRTTPIGEWISVTYSAGNYTAGGSMTWTVDDADETVKYALVGKTMFLSAVIANSDVGGTASNSLRIAIPGGFTTSGFTGGVVSIRDAGTWTTGFCEGTTSSSYVSIYRYDIANFTLTTGDNTDVRAMIIIPLT